MQGSFLEVSKCKGLRNIYHYYLCNSLEKDRIQARGDCTLFRNVFAFFFLFSLAHALRCLSLVFYNRDLQLSLPEFAQAGCLFVNKRTSEGYNLYCTDMFPELFSVLCLVTCFSRTSQTVINPSNLNQYG